MDLQSVYVVLTFAVATQAVCTPESQDVIESTGSNTQFHISNEDTHYISHRRSFWYENEIIMNYIYRLYNYTGDYYIPTSYSNRLVIHGYMDSPYAQDWNMTITLLNVSQGDAGQYELRGRRKPLTNATFCLNVLGFPAVYVSNSSNLKTGIFVMEGEDLIISGRPATILPNNSHYDVSMTWLLNDKVLLPAGPFTVREDKLIIWPVPASLNGANVTFRATIVGHNATTSVTTQIFVVSKSGIEVMLHPSRTVYDVTEGHHFPDVICHFTYSQPIHITWSHNEHIVSNGSVLSLGQVYKTMSGEYTCSVAVLSTGMRKGKSIYVIVDEVYEKPSVVSTIILSAVTGLVVVALVVLGIYQCRKMIRKRDTKPDESEKQHERPLEMNPYTSLQRESRDQQLYETADRSFTMEPPAILPIEHRVYENQLVP